MGERPRQGKSGGMGTNRGSQCMKTISVPCRTHLFCALGGQGDCQNGWRKYIHPWGWQVYAIPEAKFCFLEISAPPTSVTLCYLQFYLLMFIKQDFSVGVNCRWRWNTLGRDKEGRIRERRVGRGRASFFPWHLSASIAIFSVLTYFYCWVKKIYRTWIHFISRANGLRTW